MKRVWSKLQLLAVVVIIASLLTYGFWPRPINVDTVLVKQGALTVTVDDDGETRIREKYIISAPVTGHLLRLQLHPARKAYYHSISNTNLASYLNNIFKIVEKYQHVRISCDAGID